MTSIRHLPGNPRFLRVNANDETNLLTLNDDAGGSPTLQFREQGAERHRVIHNPAVGTEGSYQLVSATGRVDVSIDHETGAASSFAAIPTVLTVAVTDSASFQQALTDYNGIVTPLTISLAAGTYDATTVFNATRNFSDLTIIGPDVGNGFVVEGVNGGTLVSAGNDLTVNPDFVDPPVTGGTIRIFDGATETYSDFTITNVPVVGTYTLSVAPPAAFVTGDAAFVTPAAIINNWPGGVLNMQDVWYGTRSNCIFENVWLDTLQFYSGAIDFQTFSSLDLRRCYLEGQINFFDRGTAAASYTVFTRQNVSSLPDYSLFTCLFLSDAAFNATNAGLGHISSSGQGSGYIRSCTVVSGIRAAIFTRGVTTITTCHFLALPTAATTSFIFDRGTPIKIDSSTLTTLRDIALLEGDYGATGGSQTTTFTGIAAAGTTGVLVFRRASQFAMLTATVSGGGYFYDVNASAFLNRNGATEGPPAGAINSYLVDGVASAGPLSIIGATNATLS